MRQDGIHNLQGIMDRCVVDDITGCWIWKLAHEDGVPRCHVSCDELGRGTISARRASWFFGRGRLLSGRMVYRSADCPSERCVNPQHLCQGTSGGQLRAMLKRNGCTPQKLVQLTKARSGQLLSRETVFAVVADLAAGMKVKDAAKKHRINYSTASKISCGKHAHQRGIAVANSSVFSMGATMRGYMKEAA